MLDDINYDVGIIRFEGINVFDEYREPELHQANLLWKEGKYKGALLFYNSVIAESTRQYRVSELKVSCLNKLRLLQRLFRANKLWTINGCQQLVDLYDDYLKNLKEMEKTSRNHDNSFTTVIDAQSSLLIEKGKLVENLADVATALPIYEAALGLINNVITLEPTYSWRYYQKEIQLSRMRRGSDALQALAEAKELTTDITLLEEIEEAVKVIQKGSHFF